MDLKLLKCKPNHSPFQLKTNLKVNLAQHRKPIFFIKNEIFKVLFNL